MHFHIPKTGGTSLTAWFKERNGAPGLVPAHNLPLQHLTVCSEEEFEAWPKYVVVRNTWARLVSLYKFNNRRRPKTAWAPFRNFIERVVEARGDKPTTVRSQLLWIPDVPNTVVCRFEDIETTFPGVKHKNGSRDKTPYTEFYTDETRDMVADAYRDEIKNLGFYYGE